MRFRGNVMCERENACGCVHMWASERESACAWERERERERERESMSVTRNPRLYICLRGSIKWREGGGVDRSECDAESSTEGCSREKNIIGGEKKQIMQIKSFQNSFNWSIQTTFYLPPPHSPLQQKIFIRLDKYSACVCIDKTEADGGGGKSPPPPGRSPDPRDRSDGSGRKLPITTNRQEIGQLSLHHWWTEKLGLTCCAQRSEAIWYMRVPGFESRTWWD